MRGHQATAASAARADARDGAPAIVLYDGDCGFCSASAAKGRKYQRVGALEWLDNGSPRAKQLLQERGLSGKEEETLVVLDGDHAYLHSDAVVRSAQGLRWPWRMYAGIRFLPKSWRDAWYLRLAADRDKHACHLPPAPVRGEP